MLQLAPFAITLNILQQLAAIRNSLQQSACATIFCKNMKRIQRCHDMNTIYDCMRAEAQRCHDMHTIYNCMRAEAQRCHDMHTIHDCKLADSKSRFRRFPFKDTRTCTHLLEAEPKPRSVSLSMSTEQPRRNVRSKNKLY